MLIEVCGNDREGADFARRLRTALVTYDFETGEERDTPLRSLESVPARRGFTIALEALSHMRRRGSVIAASSPKLWMGEQHEDPHVHHARRLAEYERRAAECEAAGLPLPERPAFRRHPHPPKEFVGEGSLAARHDCCAKTVRRSADMLRDALLRVYQPPTGSKGSLEATRPKKRASTRRTYARWEFLGRPPRRILARLQAQWGERSFNRATGIRDDAQWREDRRYDCHEAERVRLREARRMRRQALEQPPAQGPPLADGFPLEPPSRDEFSAMMKNHGNRRSTR